MDKEMQKLVQSLPNVEWKEGENVYHEFEDYYFERNTAITTLQYLKTWEVRTDDTFVLAYPKAGNTWMLQIINLIMNDGNVKADETNIAFRVPFLEMSPVKHFSQVDMVPAPPVLLNDMPSPRLIKTHLPYKILPKKLFDTNPKVIYVARNPKDLVVSYYYFSKYNLVMPDYATFGDFLDDFCAAKLYGGHYLEEVRFWWDKRNDPNVLFIKFEDMKRDLPRVVAKVATFLNHPLSTDAITNVIVNSDFKRMKDNPAANPDKTNHYPPHKTTLKFMRKGAVGDWRNHYTVAQNEAFDKYYQRNMKDTTLSFDFELNKDDKH